MYEMEEPGGMFAPDSWCGKTCRERSPATEAQTLGRFCKKPSGSSSRKRPLFLCLSADGLWQDASLARGGDWSVAWRVLDAQFWGVPQRRRRIALVADFGGECAPEILFEREGVCWHYPARRTAGQGTASHVEGGLDDAEPNGVRCLNPWDSQTIRQYDINGVSPRLSSNATGGQNRAGVCVPVTYEMTGFGSYSSSDVAGTQLCRQYKDATDLVCYPDTARALATRHDGGPCPDHGPKMIAFTNRGQPGGDISETLRYGYCVRRMTPLECERLQGFPDGWTDIGAWTDSKGKLHPECTDSNRYKALGNSIALPPWLYILQRVSLCCGTDRTMASLFDGIGGFPLIWEYLNGRGSCLWASEIEEFPMAVTKYHFPDAEEEERSED